jgi:hypothetical protein
MTSANLSPAEQLFLDDAVRTVEDGHTWRLMFPKWLAEPLKRKAFVAAIKEALPKAKVEVIPESPKFPRPRVVAKLTDAEKKRRARAASKAQWNQLLDAYLTRNEFTAAIEQWRNEGGDFPIPDDEYIRRYAS